MFAKKVYIMGVLISSFIVHENKKSRNLYHSHICDITCQNQAFLTQISYIVEKECELVY